MDTRYNIYDYDFSAGVMSHVVINTSREGVNDTKVAMGIVHRIFVLAKAGNTYNGNSFVKYVDDTSFATSASFSGSFKFNCAYDELTKSYQTATKELKFDIGSTWIDNGSGIALAFVA